MTWIVGIQGPQGCGKSTMAAALVEEWGRRGVRATAVSIDDFYLTHAEQEALAARHPDNPYLRYRGYPGTHDISLGRRTLDEIDSLVDGQSAHVPVYDKSAHHGRGDRAPESAWRRVSGSVDVLVVEGWMLGFAPVDEGVAQLRADPALLPPNTYLPAYRVWHERLDSFVHMHTSTLETIVRWRMDSERARRRHGEPALSDEETRDYIERFLPAYRLWVPQLGAAPPCSEVFTIELTEDRRRSPADAFQRILDAGRVAARPA